MKKILFSTLFMSLFLAYNTLQAQEDCPFPNQHALDFDGTDDYVQINNPLSGNADFTFECWVLKSGTNNDFYRYLGLGGTDTRFELGDRNGFLTLYYFTSTAGGGQEKNGTNIEDGNWHHVAVVRDGANALVYLDGVLDISFDNLTNDFNFNTNMRLGRWAGGDFSGVHHGGLDEARYWNYPRTLEEILATKDCPLEGREEGLLFYYDFNQGVPSGGNSAINTVFDVSPNGTNGELNNFILEGEASNWVCSDVELKFAEPVDPCDNLTLQTDTLICLDDNTVDIQFTITNNGSTVFEVIDFYDDLNDEVLISVPANLGQGDTYVFTHNIDPATDTIFCLKAFVFNFAEGLCCHLDECVDIEPCIDCGQTAVASRPLTDLDDCCHSLTLTNNNGDFYTEVVANITTPGIVFSDVIAQNGANISGGNGTNSMSIDIGGAIPTGNNLVADFCLDGVNYSNQVPQEIIFEWYGLPDGMGETFVVCRDTLIFECTECAYVEDQNFFCDPFPTLNFNLTDLPGAPFASYIRVDIIEPTNIGFADGCIPIYEEVSADASTPFSLIVQNCNGGSPSYTGEVKYRITVFNDTTGICCVLDTLSFIIETCPNPNEIVAQPKQKDQYSENDIQLQISPNPFQEQATIEIYAPQDTEATLAVLDINNQVLFEVEQSLKQGINYVPFEKGKLSNGLYYYRLKSEAQTVVKPMILME